MSPEDHDALIRLEERFDGLRSDVAEMRGEMRENHGTLSAAVLAIKDTLARNGINGASRAAAATGGITLALSRRTLVWMAVGLLAVLSGTVALRVDWPQLANATAAMNSVAKLAAPP